MESPPVQLLYEKKPSPPQRRRRWLIFSVVLVTMLFVVARVGPPVLRRIKLLYYERQTLTHVESRGTLCVGESVAVGPYDPSMNQFSPEPQAGPSPADAFLNLFENSPYPVWRGVVFSHARKRPDGAERIVIITGISQINVAGTSYSKGCFWRVFERGNLTKDPKELLSANSGAWLPNFTQFLSIYAGQPDPLDESHFWFDIMTENQRITYDGWLRNDDTVVIEPRPATSTPAPTLSPALSR